MGRSGRFALVVALVVVVAAGVVYLTLNGIVRFGVERGGTIALGVETEVDSVDVRPLRGRFGLSGLSVANPEGFRSTHFLKLDEGNVRVAVGTLRSDELVMTLVSLSGIELSLEGGTKGTNYGAILDNLAQLGEGGATGEAEPGGQTLRIRELVIEDVSAHAEMNIGGRVTKVDLRIPDVRLKNLSSSSSAGGIGAQMAGVITTALLRAVAKEGSGLPAGLERGLRGGLGNVSDYAVGELDRLGGEDLGTREEVEKTVEKAEEALKRGIGRLLDRDDR
jgi:hypothetical protein